MTKEQELKQKQEERYRLDVRLRKMHQNFVEAIEKSHGNSREETLLSQADILDSIFRKSLAETEHNYSRFENFAIALKAQNQYRHALLAHKVLKDKNSDVPKK